jgi:uncharacterized protein (DUF433 family)
MPGETSYVRTDEFGVFRIGTTRVSLDSVIAAWEQGHSPETIQSQYPALTLEQVYGALAWCLAHADEVEVYRKRQEGVWTAARAEAEARGIPPVVRRLRELRAARDAARAKGA